MRAADLLPFRDAIAAGAEAVMMAHVEYPAMDAVPAGFSRRWIGDVLRGELGFNGIVFSDDIGMSAAATAGGVGARIAAHLDAGCDIVLACAPATAVEAIAAVARRPALEPARLSLLRGTVAPTWEGLMNNPMRARVIAALAPLREPPA
jgi:beta-N-acetylhexosaminidase